MVRIGLETLPIPSVSMEILPLVLHSYLHRLPPRWFCVLVLSLTIQPLTAVALPPPDDIPEEVLRNEVITGARSPIDGKPLSAAEYAVLQEKIQERPIPTLDSDLRQLIFLLQIRKFLRTFIPVIP